MTSLPAAASTQISSSFENKLVPDALGSGQHLTPADVVVINDMIVVTDSGTSRISVFDMDGNFISRFGTQGETLAGEIESPMGITTDGEHLYIAGNPEVTSLWALDDTGTSAGVQGMVPASGETIGPLKVAIDGNGKIYVIGGPSHHDESLPYSIQKYDTTGMLLAEADNSGFIAPSGIAVAGSYVFVAESYSGEQKIIVYNSDMTASDIELELPQNTIPGDIDTVGTELYVSVSSYTGGINGIIRYDISLLDPVPGYTQVADTTAVLEAGMVVNGIDVDEHGDIYLATSSGAYSRSGQILVYDAEGDRFFSFPEQTELYCMWGLEHDDDGKVYMLPLTFDGSSASIWTVNIDGTEMEELVELENTGGTSVSIDDANHIWYTQMTFGFSGLTSSGIHVLDMQGNELYNLACYSTSLTQDPATGEVITDGSRDIVMPTSVLTCSENGKNYVYITDSAPSGWFNGGSGMVSKLEYDENWNFEEVWSAGIYIDSEPGRDLSQDPAGENEFSMPCSLALHPDGDVLYVVDAVYWRVAMLDPEDGSWIGEFEAPELPDGYTRYSESTAHVMSETEGYEEDLLMPTGVDVDPDSGLVYVSFHGGSGANVYSKEGEYVGFVGSKDIDEGGIVASLTLDIMPTEDNDTKHVIIGDAHGFSVNSYEVTTSTEEEEIHSIEDTDNVGILVVAHGSTSESWCNAVRDAVADADLVYPVEIGFLEMVDNESIPDAVEKLEGQGVTGIVAVPLFVSSSSGHIEEIRYILGLSDDVPDEDFERVDTDAKIVMCDAMDDHSFIAEIIADRAAKLTDDAEGETVVIVFHGTTDEQFEGWNKSACSLAGKTKLILRHSTGIDIGDVRYGFINVDASSEEYELSNVVSEVSETSHPIVIPVFICEGYYTNTKIPSLLKGLDYEYPEAGERTLTPHTCVGDWMEVMAARELPYPEISIYDDGDLLALSTEDIETCLCGITAYRSSLEAFSHKQVWSDVPLRGDISITSAHPSDGHEELFLYILGNLHEDYTVDVPDGTNITYIRPENYVYTFVQKSTDNSATVSVKDEVFPENMYELRTKALLGAASKEEKQAFQLLKSIMQERMAYSPSDELFEASIVLPGGLAINSGWNFISMPTELHNSNIDDVLADVNYDAIVYYNTASGMWEVGGVDFTDLDPLKAYWIKNPEASVQYLTKDMLEPKVPAVPASMTVHKGWNAIGYSDTKDPLSAEMTLQSMDDSYSLIKGPYNPADRSYGYVGHNGETGIVSGSHVGTDVFEMLPYNGYWVFVTQETTLYGF
ncbi:CbiX/SirB N-terminal domain-containing protein [Methanolobus psychrotolerans]|uniref:CbiX/SirB N-terminal domain-containing protein n=1 Tax=Methanolobus psychrotolerans TaxID=1874706 RepID=UPI0013EA6242|nr:CbiX/SirB N-terminal domain-containing protein [Methanolobus psychrotolerans]